VSREDAMGERTWRPLGFLLLMLGFGLRLDTPWLGLGWVLIVAGALCGGGGLWPLVRRRGSRGAFVLPRGGE